MKKSIILLLIFILVMLISCGDSTSDENLRRIHHNVITDNYYSSWDFSEDKGNNKISSNDRQNRDAIYYEKLDSNGNRIIKGFYYGGLKQDFWSYYDTKGNITKIEFYNNGEITQTINYD